MKTCGSTVTNRLSARFIIAAVIGGLSGCAWSSHRAYHPVLEKLTAVDTASVSTRSVTDLDINGDGTVDARDASFFDDLHRKAQAAWQASSQPTTPRLHNYYQGLPNDEPSVYQMLYLSEQSPHLDRVPVERLQELMVESKWLAQQAKVASLHNTKGKQHSIRGLLRHWLDGYDPDAMAPLAVCTALEAFDVATIVQAGVTPAAVFDLDGTVWSGHVMNAFLAAITELGLPKPVANPALQNFLQTLEGIDKSAVSQNDISANTKLFLHYATSPDVPKASRPGAKEVFYAVAALLQGASVQEVEKAAEKVFIEGSQNFPPWRGQLYADPSGCGTRRIIEVLQQRGVAVYLLSATLDPLVQQAGKTLGVARATRMGSTLELKDGRYTGQVAHNTYAVKSPVVRQWLKSPPLFVFGDSARSDFPMMMEAVSTAFMVNPGSALTERDTKAAKGDMVTIEFAHQEGNLEHANQ